MMNSGPNKKKRIWGRQEKHDLKVELIHFFDWARALGPEDFEDKVCNKQGEMSVVRLVNLYMQNEFE